MAKKEPAAPAQPATFWQEYKVVNKDDLVKTGESFDVTRVEINETRWGLRFVLTVTTDDGSEGTITFDGGEGESAVGTRDVLLRSMLVYLEQAKTNGAMATVRTRLSQVGRAVLVLPGE